MTHSLTDHVRQFAEDFVARCTGCEKCFEACPIAPFTDLADCTGESALCSLLHLLQGSPDGGPGETWARSCTSCGLCVPACPEGLSPRRALAMAESELLRVRSARGENPFTNAFARWSEAIRLTAGTQIGPAEWEQLVSRPRLGKPRAEVLFYFGCNVLRMPHIVLIVAGILEGLGVDYELLGGVGNCCGILHFRWHGDAEGAGKILDHTLTKMARFEPRKVITWCPSCQMFLGDTVTGYDQSGLQFQHLSSFLLENLDSLRQRFVQPLPIRAALHRHGGLPGVADAAEKVLAAIPGLELVQLEEMSACSYTCDVASLSRAPRALAESHRRLIENARAAQIDTLIDMYHGCHMLLCGEEARQPFGVENFVSVIGRAMGLDVPEDRYKRYKLLGETQSVLAESRELVEANGLNPKALEEALPRLFGWGRR